MDRSKLNRALSSDDTPTPGYLYGEIARMTQSGPDVSLAVTELVLARLRKGNHNTKWKALLVIKQVCRLSRSDFRARLARNTGEVKECLQYRGPPDPLRGDAIYKRVREAAKDALEAIYEEGEAALPPGLPNSRIQGFGSNPEGPQGLGYGGQQASMGGGMVAMAAQMRDRFGPGDPAYMGGDERRTAGGHQFQGGGSGMQGFGNPNMPDYRGQKTMMERVGEGVLELGKQVATQVPSLRELRMPGSAKASLFDGPPGNMPSNRGPNADRWMGGGGAYAPQQISGGAYGNQGHGNNGYSDHGGSQPRYGGESGGYAGASQPDPSESYYQHGQSGNGAAGLSSGGNRGRGQVGGSWGRPGPGGASPASTGPSLASAAPAPMMAASTGSGRAGGAAADGGYERQKVGELCAPGGLRAVPPKAEMDAFVQECETLDAALVAPVLLDTMGTGAEEGNWRVTAKALVLADALAKRHHTYRGILGSEEAVDLIVPHAESSVASVRDRAIKLLRTLGVELQFDDEEPAEPAAAAAATESGSGPPAAPLQHAVSTPAPMAQSAPIAAAPVQDLLGGYDDAPVEAPARDQAPALVPVEAAAVAESQAPSAPVPEAAPGAPQGNLFSGLATHEAPLSTPGAPAPVPDVPDTISEPPADMFAELSLKETAAPPPVATPQAPTPQAPAPHAPAPQAPAPAEKSLLDFDAPDEPVMAPMPAAGAGADPLSLLDPLGRTHGQGAAPATSTSHLDLLAPPTAQGPAAMPGMPTDPVQAQLMQLQYQNQMLQQQMMHMQRGVAPGPPGPPRMRNDFSAMASPTTQQRPSIPNMANGEKGGAQRPAAGGTESAFGFMNAGAPPASKAFDFVNDELAKKR